MRIILAFIVFTTTTGCHNSQDTCALKSYKLSKYDCYMAIIEIPCKDTVESICLSGDDYTVNNKLTNRVEKKIELKTFKREERWCQFENELRLDPLYDSIIKYNKRIDRFTQRCINKYEIVKSKSMDSMEQFIGVIFEKAYGMRGYGRMFRLTKSQYSLMSDWWNYKNQTYLDSIKNSSKGSTKDELTNHYHCIFLKQKNAFDAISNHPSLDYSYYSRDEDTTEWFVVAPDQKLEMSVIVKFLITKNKDNTYSFNSQELNPPHPKEFSPQL